MEGDVEDVFSRGDEDEHHVRIGLTVARNEGLLEFLEYMGWQCICSNNSNAKLVKITCPLL